MKSFRPRIENKILFSTGSRNKENQVKFKMSLGFGRGSRVEGKMSRVRVKCRGSIKKIKILNFKTSSNRRLGKCVRHFKGEILCCGYWGR